MSVCNVLLWAVGMPWFRRRNQHQIEKTTQQGAEMKVVSDSEATGI